MPLAVDSLVASIPQAISRLAGKTVVTSPWRTAEWAEIPLALRDRAFFSAGVESVAVLARARQLLDEWAALNPGQAFRDRSKFVAEMRQTLGAMPGDSGSLTDIASRRRLELIYNFQTTQAAEYARFVVGNDPAVLEAFPCQELVRVESREVPRDWISRWQAAGGQLYGGRMIALKTDDIWTRISRFGTPFPPFDFGSGMGVADVERDEAVGLGVIPADYTPDPDRTPLAGFNDNLQQSIAGLDDAGRADLKELFLDQVKIEGDTVQWVTPDWMLESNLRLTPDQLAELIPANRKTLAIATLDAYVNDQYETLNRHPHLRDAINLDNLTRRLAPVTDADVVWRGIDFRGDRGEMDRFLNQVRQGRWTSPQTLLSASRSFEEGNGRAAVASPAGVLVEIRGIRTGRDLAPMVKALGYEAMALKEQEVVFLRGTEFKVVEIKESSREVFMRAGGKETVRYPHVVLAEVAR